jgi:hypothetical protein
VIREAAGIFEAKEMQAFQRFVEIAQDFPFDPDLRRLANVACRASGDRSRRKLLQFPSAPDTPRRFMPALSSFALQT